MIKILKNIILIIFIMMSVMTTFSQTNNFGIGTLTPDQSSILELVSTTKGFLIPRMLLNDKDNILNPATGLLIYQTDGLDGFCYWDGTHWVKILTGISFDFVMGEGDPGQVAYWTSSKTISGSNEFFWDFNDSYLGLGTINPLEKVDVDGALIISNTSNTFDGTIRFTGTDFEGWMGNQWVSFTSNTLYGHGQTGQVTFWETNNYLSGNNNLFWDIGNSQLGIGTMTPREALDINGGLVISNTSTSITGNIRWTGADFEGWDGSEWKSFTQYLINGTGSRGQVAFWVGAHDLFGSDGLFWDIDNSYLGIGTTTPRSPLEINGAFIMGDITNPGPILPGTMRWSGTDFEGYMGGIWVSFTTTPDLWGGGLPGQVTIWVDPITLGGDPDLIWDNANKNLGVRNPVPEYNLDVGGNFVLGLNGTSGQLRFYAAPNPAEYEVIFNTSGSMTTSTSYTLPTTDGTPGGLNLLTTDGSGNLYWTDPTQGSSLYWEKINNVIVTTGDWGIGNINPVFGGTKNTHVLFGRNSVVSSANYSTILNGVSNVISANYATIYTGNLQTVSGNYSTSLGGQNNSMSGSYSVVFGNGNQINADYSIIEGGQNTTLTGSGSYLFKGASAAQTLGTSNIFAPVDIHFHFNPTNGDADFIVDGTIDNVFYMNSASDGVAINNDSAVVALDIYDGNMAITTTGTVNKIYFYEPSTDAGDHYSSFAPTSQTYNLEYTLPPEHEEPNSILINNGFGVLTWADPGTFAEYLRANVVVLTTASTYNCSEFDNHIIVKTSGNCTVNLPPAALMNGKEILVKKGDFVGGNVEVYANGTETIDGLTLGDPGYPPNVNQRWESLFFVCDGTAWYVMARFP